MERTSFFIEFFYNSNLMLVEVKPCCQENHVFYYDIAIKNQYQFTLTPTFEGDAITWKVSFKNADKLVDPNLIELIGNEIEKAIFQIS